MTLTFPNLPRHNTPVQIMDGAINAYPPGFKPTLDLRWGYGEGFPANINTSAWARVAGDKWIGRSGDGQLSDLGANEFRTHTGFDGVPRGLVVENTGINLALHSRDLSNAAYVKSNTTGVKDATGTDGVANSASTLTADANAGTCLQTITLASAARTYSVYVKRKTGTGTIEITDNNLANATDITASLSTTQWTRFQLTRTQANPVVGFRLGTSGDEIEVDFNQVEALPFASSPVGTTTVAASRPQDNLLSTSMDWFLDGGPGMIYVKVRMPAGYTVGGFHSIISLTNNVSNDEQINIAIGTTGKSDCIYRAGGVISARPIGLETVVADQIVQIAFTWDTNDFASSINGAAVVTDALGALTTGIDRFTIGNGLAAAGNFHFFGGIQQISYWPLRGPNDYLSTLTS